jgi:hypothetical protein
MAGAVVATSLGRDVDRLLSFDSNTVDEDGNRDNVDTADDEEEDVMIAAIGWPCLTNQKGRDSTTTLRSRFDIRKEIIWSRKPR